MSSNRIGLIAGYGRFPLLYAQTLKAQGYSIFCAAIREETDPSVLDWTDGHTWLHLGQLGKLVAAFRQNGITRAVMAGKIHKTRLYKLRPDLRAAKLMAQVPNFNDDTLLKAIAEELERHGVVLASSLEHAGELLSQPGVATQRAPNRDEQRDIAFGWEVATAMASLDIGQSVVVKQRAVVAVEAIEGTDATIRRGGELGGGKVTVVKVAKPAQDSRFDVPTVGPETIRTMAASGGTCLGLQAGWTLVLDRLETLALANAHGISVVLETTTSGPPTPSA